MSDPPGARAATAPAPAPAGGPRDDAPARNDATPREVPATTSSRPSFAAAFPRSPELDAAVDAFVRGEYRAARERADRLAASGASADIKRAARTLAERTHPDPAAVLLLALATALLTVLGGWWIAHAKPPSAHPPAAVVPRE